MGAERQELGLSSDVYDGLRLRYLEFLVISQPSLWNKYATDLFSKSPRCIRRW
ncbi:hypothetical protein [Nostoc sp.]|uniref:hypothetical protein n=1 Tax=Nostoc sp. TaxID=1180 RepID=UPI002FF6D5F2